MPISVGARLPTPCGQRHDVVVERGRCGGGRRSTPRVSPRSRSHSSCVGPMAPFWRKKARCLRAHESRPTKIASASGTWRFHAPHGLELEARARGDVAPARALALVRRARAGAARDGEQVQVVVAGDGERAGPVPPARERRLDELPALAVVGAVAGDAPRRRRSPRRRRAPRAGSAGWCCAASSRASAPARPRRGGPRRGSAARRASRRHAFAAARSTGSSNPPLSRAVGTGWP